MLGGLAGPWLARAAFRRNVDTVGPGDCATLNREVCEYLGYFKDSNTGPLSQSEKSMVPSTPSSYTSPVLNSPPYSAWITAGRMFMHTTF
jgi:hypothetical protein